MTVSHHTQHLANRLQHEGRADIALPRHPGVGRTPTARREQERARARLYAAARLAGISITTSLEGFPHAPTMVGRTRGDMIAHQGGCPVCEAIARQPDADGLTYCRHCGAAWRELPDWPLRRHESICAYAITCPSESCQAAIGEHCAYPGGQTKQEPHSVRERLAREFPVEPLDED